MTPLRCLRLPEVRGMICGSDEPSNRGSLHKDSEFALRKSLTLSGVDESTCPYDFNSRPGHCDSLITMNQLVCEPCWPYVVDPGGT